MLTHEKNGSREDKQDVGWDEDVTVFSERGRAAVSSANSDSVLGDTVNRGEGAAYEAFNEDVTCASSGSNLFSSPKAIRTLITVICVTVVSVSVILVIVKTRRKNGADAVDTAQAGNSGYNANRVAYVNTLELNLRMGPGSEYSSITKLPRGDAVTCLEEARSSDGGAWVRVRAGSNEGWVNQKLISADRPQPLPQAEAAMDDGTWVVSLGRVGGVHVVGMTVQQAAVALGRKLQKGSEDVNEGCSFATIVGGEASISFMVIDGRIARIDITGAAIPYEGGIRVGDAEDKVKSLFKGRLKIEPHTYDEKGHYLQVREGNFGVVFETDGKQVTGIRSGRTPEYEYVEGCA